MTRLIIKNVGPIQEVDMELNKVNVIIGPQSSGKSTIDKIACYCSWVEKQVCLEQSFDYFTKQTAFIDELVRFHKLQGYFDSTSVINYESEVVRIEYVSEIVRFEWGEGRWMFQRPKISYIPAERNMVAAIPNWFAVKFQDNNILSFMTDWGDSRSQYTKDRPLSIMNLGADYYYEEGTNTDYVKLANGKTLTFTATSSGLQSLIPLYALIYSYEFHFENIDKLTSYATRISTKEVIEKIYQNRFRYHTTVRGDSSSVPKSESFPYNGRTCCVRPGEKDVCIQTFDAFTRTQHCNLFVEEPEQNLFPATQLELIYELVKGCLTRDHRLFITTHSPYILYALNNCMMGYLVKDKMLAEDAQEVRCKSSWIDPKLVSVWEIKEGLLIGVDGSKNTTIQHADGLIGNNYFDRNMKEVMDDFYKMLNFYEDDQE